MQNGGAVSAAPAEFFASRSPPRRCAGGATVVHINHPAKFRKLVPAYCQYCGTKFLYRPAGRPPLYCDKQCRDGEFRRSRYLPSKNGESRPKTKATSKTSSPDFADRAPLNILGGYRWPNGRAVDRELMQKIIRVEIGGRAP
jgi:hypothetical protein